MMLGIAPVRLRPCGLFHAWRPDMLARIALALILWLFAAMRAIGRCAARPARPMGWSGDRRDSLRETFNPCPSILAWAGAKAHRSAGSAVSPEPQGTGRNPRRAGFVAALFLFSFSIFLRGV